MTAGTLSRGFSSLVFLAVNLNVFDISDMI